MTQDAREHPPPNGVVDSPFLQECVRIAEMPVGGTEVVLDDTSERDPRRTLRIVGGSGRRRTACANRSSWEKTITWRVFADRLGQRRAHRPWSGP